MNGLLSLQEQLDLKLNEAVKPYVGIPVALSGGLDSSLLAALINPKFVVSVKLPGGPKYNEIDSAITVAKHLRLRHEIVETDFKYFEPCVKGAVLAIGRAIPHFNIFPLYVMYERLSFLGVREVVLGDGPDESMCGYARDLIIAYLYKIYDFYAFENYKQMIDKILPRPEVAISLATGQPIEEINRVAGGLDPVAMSSVVNQEIMRKDMDDMSDGIAKRFGIKNIRPYQDNKELDNFMKNLPLEAKINNVEFGKYLLRKVAEKYLPYSIAWRKQKKGGPVYPVNIMMDWMQEGEFSKKKWLEYQQNILNSN